MTSKRIPSIIATPLLLLAGMFGPAEEARASQGVHLAQLGCLVDTFAFDTLEIGYCGAAWTPGGATNPTIAYFEIVGLPPGNYSYAWTNLETGGNPGCWGSTCTVPIATETYGDGYAALAVTITNLNSGAQNTVSAEAIYLDGWR